MGIFERIQGLQQRLPTYAPWEVVLELAVIWLVVYLIVRFVQGTRAAGALKGLLVILVVLTVLSRVLAAGGNLPRVGLLYDKFIALIAIGLVVIFQPELRRALIRLGETSFLRSTPKDIKIVVEEVADAARYLSRASFGALIVLERQTKLNDLVEGGTKLGAELSSRLLQTLFFPGSALHDLACVIKGRVIDAAGVQLPLADPSDMPDASFGSRHRAAVGLTQQCDAIVVIVSEETGNIRIAEQGRLSEPLSDEELREELTRRLTSTLDRKMAGMARGGAAGLPMATMTAEERREQNTSLMDTMAGTPGVGSASPADSIAGDSRMEDTPLPDGANGSGESSVSAVPALLDDSGLVAGAQTDAVDDAARQASRRGERGSERVG